MWCPNCRSEYREGYERCTDCDIALIPESPPSPPEETHRPRRLQFTIAFARSPIVVAVFVAGVALGAVVARPAQRLLFRYGRHHNSQAVMSWAYRHLPEIVGEGARTLDMTLVPETRSEDKGQLRVVYENGGEIKVIDTPYRVVNGVVSEPTDSTLRSLDISTRGFPVPPSPRSTPSPN